MIARFLVSAIFIFFLAPAPASASSGCPNAGVLSGKLMTDFCWDCLFPMRMAGMNMGGKNSGSGSRPPGALSSAICNCTDDFGLPEFGVTYSAWMPRFLTETVQKPYCSPSLGGITLSGKTRLATGGDVKLTATPGDNRVSDSAFLNFHTLSFPILEMMELFMESSCNPDGFADIELTYISEPDPLWADNLLSTILSPEAILFTNPAAMLVCAGECNAVSLGANSLAHWCAGCWGGVYPFTGHANHSGSRVGHTSLIATKALAALHRRGLAYNTVGSEAACTGGSFAPVISKDQYRFGMFYPRPEATSNHRIGASTLLWGENRSSPAAGSNHVYVGYRFQDCCLR